MNVKLSNLLAQAESICVQAGRLERVKVLKLPWACCGGGCARMECWLKVARAKFKSWDFGGTSMGPGPVIEDFWVPRSNSKSMMSRALIHAYYVVRSSTTTIGAARTNEEQRRSARTGKEPSRPPPSSSTSPSAKSCRRSETLGQSNGHDSLLRRRGRRRPDTLRGSSSCS